MEKSLTEFPKDKHKKSGYHSHCKMCNNIKAKKLSQKYSQIENKEIKEKKVCRCCKKEKTGLEYTNNRSRKDGLASECKNCSYKYRNEYFKARKLYDPKFKLLKNMRSRLSVVLRGMSKSQTTRELIGVNFETFSKWIEFQFEEGMNMNNYGSAWHHDHVLPISSFNLLDEEELHKAMNWMNIRPMQPLKNIKKSNKITPWLYVMQQVKAHYFLKNLAET
jgi:hypothetical protein